MSHSIHPHPTPQPALIRCRIAQEEDIYLAVLRGREMAQQIGFDAIDSTRIEIAILELTRNILAHAGKGELVLEPVGATTTPTQRGIALSACDQGPGIADVQLALQDGYSTTNTLGSGLPGVHRLMDEMQIESQLGVGTTVRAVKWLPIQHTRTSVWR